MDKTVDLKHGQKDRQTPLVLSCTHLIVSDAVRLDQQVILVGGGGKVLTSWPVSQVTACVCWVRIYMEHNTVILPLRARKRGRRKMTCGPGAARLTRVPAPLPASAGLITK